MCRCRVNAYIEHVTDILQVFVVVNASMYSASDFDPKEDVLEFGSHKTRLALIFHLF